MLSSSLLGDDHRIFRFGVFGFSGDHTSFELRRLGHAASRARVGRLGHAASRARVGRLGHAASRARVGKAGLTERPRPEEVFHAQTPHASGAYSRGEQSASWPLLALVAQRGECAIVIVQSSGGNDGGCGLDALPAAVVRSHVGGGNAGCVGRSDCMRPPARSDIGGASVGCVGRSVRPPKRSHFGGGSVGCVGRSVRPPGRSLFGRGSLGCVGRSDCLHPPTRSHIGRKSKSKSKCFVHAAARCWWSAFASSLSSFIAFRDP